MGLAPVGVDCDVGQVVGIIAVEHGAVRDRSGKVCGHSATCRLHKLDARNDTVFIKPDIVVDQEVVPFFLCCTYHHRGPGEALPSRLVLSASRAAITAHCAAWVSLPPNAPPMRRTSTVMALDGRLRACPTASCTSDGC